MTLDDDTLKQMRGYIEIPTEIFGDLTSFSLQDQEKMQRLAGEYKVVPNDATVPNWITKVKQLEGAKYLEWNGYLLLEAPGGH